MGYLVAPVLFNVLDDRVMAGMLAGHMFTSMSYIGLVCGGVLVVGMVYRTGKSSLRSWQLWVLLAMLLVIIIGQFVLQPMMVELRGLGLQGERTSQFGQLHGMASILFLINSLSGLALIIFGLSNHESQSSGRG